MDKLLGLSYISVSTIFQLDFRIVPSLVFLFFILLFTRKKINIYVLETNAGLSAYMKLVIVWI
jgi:hypothetical protein